MNSPLDLWRPALAMLGGLSLLACDRPSDIVRPGHEVELSVGSVRSMRAATPLVVAGAPGGGQLWNVQTLEFTAAPLVLEDGDTIDWQPAEVRSKESVNLELARDRAANGYPYWSERSVPVRFELPDDPRLFGQQLEARVQMALLVASDERPPHQIAIDTLMTLAVATRAQAEAYEAGWLSRGATRWFMGLMGVALVGVCLLAMSRLLPRYGDQ